MSKTESLVLFMLLIVLLVSIVFWDYNTAPRGEFSIEEVKYAAKKLGVSFTDFTPQNLKKGMDKELEHGRINPFTNVTDDDLIVTAKIALAHLYNDSRCYC